MSMSSVGGVALFQVALTQARVRADISTQVLKKVQEIGSQQALQLARQLVETAEAMNASRAADGRLDAYA